MSTTYRRGVQTFKDLFGQEETLTEEKTKGRDAELIAERDTLMYHRYYYYGAIHGLLFEQVMKRLKGDFFLSEDTIPRIIDKYSNEIQQLRNKKADVKYLREKYPDWVWRIHNCL